MSKIMRKKHVRVENNDLLCAEIVKFVKKDTKFDIWSVIYRICMHFSDQNWLILVVSSMESSKRWVRTSSEVVKVEKESCFGGHVGSNACFGTIFGPKIKIFWLKVHQN